MYSIRTLCIATLLVAILALAAGCTQPQNSPANAGSQVDLTPPMAGTSTATSAPISTGSWHHVRLETTMGNITIALDPSMPLTAGNFETLVGKGFYNGVIFHRVIDGFMIQGGDPTGTGRGGPGYTIKDEFGPANRNDRGTIAMANSGPNTGGSQFFINLADNNYLDTKHPVFGKVVDGMDVVDAIAKVPTTGDAGGYRPLQNVTIIRTEMI